MEGLINPYKNNKNLQYYRIYEDIMFCSSEGVEFIDDDDFKFELNISKLDSIISEVLNKLEGVDDCDNKKNIIDTIHEKQNLLKDILTKYKEIENKYYDDDQFYRLELFQFYRIEYNESFNLNKRKKFFSIGLEIQKILKDKYKDFLNNYCALIDKLIEINNYVLKVNILFNFKE